MEHAIRTSPGGVSHPIQVIILRAKNGDSQARELTDAELGEPRQAMELAEKSLTNAVTSLDVQTPSPPDPPQRKELSKFVKS